MSIGIVVDTAPSDGITYTANTAFGSGSQIGTANYVVYKGTGSTVTVTGLSKLTNYYINVYTFNGTGGTENFLTTNPATGSQPQRAPKPAKTSSPCRALGGGQGDGKNCSW